MDQLIFFSRDGRELLDPSTVREAGLDSGDVVHFYVDADEDRPPPLCTGSESSDSLDDQVCEVAPL
jgi:hypothetical protein